MKILIINYEYPPLGGGASKQSYLLANELSKRHKIIVLTSHFNNFKTVEHKNPGLTIYRVPVFRKYPYRVRVIELLLFIISGFIYSLHIARKEKIDVVISFFASPSGLIAYFLKRLFKIPYIVSLRGFDVPGHATKEYKLLQDLNKNIIKTVLKSADTVSTNSYHLAKLTNIIYPDLKIFIIPNAVQIKNFVRTRRNKDILKIITVGRLNLLKGFSELIDAITLLKTDKKYKLYIVGDGPLKNSLEKKTKDLGLKKRIVFCGWMERKKLDHLYQQSDIFVFLSHEEGMSNVLLESISFGLPIVATDIPANQGIVENNINGFLVKPGDINNTVNKLTLLIDNPTLREKFGKQSKKIAKRFDVQNMVNSFESVANKIVIPEDYNTARAFSFSWNNLPSGAIYSSDQFRDWLSPLGPKDIKGRTVLEMGCGNASLMIHMAKWKPKYLEGIDLGDSVESAVKNMEKTKFSNWEIKKADLISYNDKKLDLVYCIGVLHHLKNPHKGFKSILKSTKEGGKFHCWVYAKEGNEVVRSLVEPIRKICSKLPWRITKYFIASALARIFFIYAKTLNSSKNLSLIQNMPEYQYSLWISKREFKFFHHVIFDQLISPRTSYLDKKTVQSWLKSPEINQESTYLIMRNGNSWKFGGRKNFT